MPCFLWQTKDDWGQGGKAEVKGDRVSKINLTEAACLAAVLLKWLLNLLRAVPTIPDIISTLSIYANATVHTARQ